MQTHVLVGNKGRKVGENDEKLIYTFLDNYVVDIRLYIGEKMMIRKGILAHRYNKIPQ